jgi:hypothetical protein
LYAGKAEIEGHEEIFAEALFASEFKPRKLKGAPAGWSWQSGVP